ncbi:membrane-associating domain-containing protein [Nemania serpens]|nr:membrane-associating domain-containing protein [Nemania serpens]
MVLTRIASIVLRIAELVFATIVAGINGDYLHSVRNASSWSQGRFIYTEVVAGIAIFFSLIWLIPFAGSFEHWPVDFLISVTWFAAFGLLVDYLGGSCGAVFNWNNVRILRGDQCGEWKAVIAFSFLSAICWLVSGIIGLIWVNDRESRAYRRRTWRGRSYV